MCGVQGEHRVAPGPNKNDLQDEREFAPHQQERAQPTATARMQRTSNASTASSSQRIMDSRVDAPSRKSEEAGSRAPTQPASKSNASTAPSTAPRDATGAAASNANKVQRVPATRNTHSNAGQRVAGLKGWRNFGLGWGTPGEHSTQRRHDDGEGL